MTYRSSWSRLHGYYQRKAASFVFKKPLVVSPARPIISFSFDDFPRSALLVGGAILKSFGLAGTYYASLGLAGKDTPSGQIFLNDDLPALFEQGHELGCHTFGHCHSWETPTGIFEESIKENRTSLDKLIPGAEFKTFSYPIAMPRPMTKARIANYFQCCRAGGQRLNVGTTDLNQLSAYFLEQSRHNIQAVRDVINVNRNVRGWLIFATHDISPNPTPFGCEPGFFEEIVRDALKSGALILPVGLALEALSASKLSSEVNFNPPGSAQRAELERS
jgi:peptidoglycan/xylan/chitin deacetylase (PgdA/CDA1 family)